MSESLHAELLEEVRECAPDLLRGLDDSTNEGKQVRVASLARFAVIRSMNMSVTESASIKIARGDDKSLGKDFISALKRYESKKSQPLPIDQAEIEAEAVMLGIDHLIWPYDIDNHIEEELNLATK